MERDTNKPNCNRCNPTIKCSGRKNDTCVSYIPPKDTFTLAELALSHPQGLHDALSSLPFETNIDLYLG